MRDRFLRRLARLVLSHPRAVIGVVVLHLAAAAVVVPGLRVEAGHSALVDPDNEHQKRFQSFLGRYGSPNLLIAVVEGGDERLRRQAIDALLESLPRRRTAGSPPSCRAEDKPRSAGCVRDAVGRVDLEKLKSRALLYLPADQVEQLVTMLKRDGFGLRKLLAIGSLPALFSAMAEAVEENAEEQGPLEGEQREQAEQVLDVFARFIALFERQVRGTRKAVPLEEALFSQSVRSGVDSRGYLSSDDGKLKLCLIRPVNDSDEPTVVVPLVGYVQRHADAAARSLGAICQKSSCPDGPLRVKLTGLPAIVADETRIVGRDVAVTSLVATAGILALFIFGFRSIRQTALGVPPLLIGMLCTLAFVRLAFGTLNLVTAAFIATLLGLGIDFAVHMLSRFNEARRKGAAVREAVEGAILGAGPGILTGALTTSGAFVALAVNDFRAFSQLGIITGVGLVFVLLTTLTLMPAMLVLPGLRRLQGKPAPLPKSPPRLDLPGVVVRRPLAFTLVGLALAGAMLLKAQQVPWSYDYIKLMPQKLTSVRSLEQLSEKTDYSAGVAAVEARSAEEARRMAARLAKMSTVRRVDALTTYVPTDQQKKLRLLAELKPILDDAAPRAAAPDSVDVAAVAEAVTTLKDSLEDARFEAKRGGADAEARMLAKPAAAVASLLRALRQVRNSDAAKRLAALRRELLDGLDQGVAVLKQNVGAEPVTVERLLDQLPAGLRDRLYNAGRFAVYAYPARSIGDKAFLERFISEVRRVSDSATGFPVTHWESSRSIEAGFRDASIAATIALVLLLLIDFRSVSYTLLALAPLGIGIAWMWGGMSLMGMDYTYVNIIAFPLIIGIGVASGVHILHRYRQEGTGDVAVVVRFTGMAVFLSAATTMVGFGSLALAQHQGAAGLGILLLVGVGSCLLAATLFLPAVLQLLRRLVRPDSRRE
jgi:hopanoid biosynthesis associated RND transporter like protein HpnN